MTELSAEEIEFGAMALAQRVRSQSAKEKRLATLLRDVEPRWVMVEGKRIAAWRVGEGPAVLLVHGSSDNHTVWSPMMQSLRARGRAFVAMDMPGYNYSEFTEPGIEPGAHALMAVAKACGPIDALIGHSIGGAMVMCALGRGLRVRKAVIIATGLFTNWELWRLKQSWAFPDDAPPSVVARAKELLGAPWNAPGMQFDACATVKNFDFPALFVHSHDDEYWSPEAAKRMSAAWPGAIAHHPVGLTHRGTARDPDICARVADFVTI